MVKNEINLLLCLFLFSSCSLSGRQPVQLLRADSLMQTAPDSSLVLLESFSDSLSLKNAGTRAWYALLLTQAYDKNYVFHTSDSLIRIAVNYYDSVSDVALQAKSHYYLGRVYQDMENAPGAAREFMTALPLVEKVKDDRLLCILYSNLGYIFYREDMLEQADSLYLLAKQLAVEQNDSIWLAVTLSMIGDIQIERGAAFYTSAERTLKQALFIAECFDNTYIEEAVLASLSSLYNYMENSLEAIRFSKCGIGLQKDTMKWHDYYLIQGRSYDRLEQYDSAVIYLTKSLSFAPYFVKREAYCKLSTIARKQGRITDALHLADSCRIYTDSAMRAVQTVELVTSVKDLLMQQTTRRYDSFLHQYRHYMYGGGVTLVLFVANFIYKRARYQSLENTLEASKAEKEELEQLYICQSVVLEQERKLSVEMEIQRMELEVEVQSLTERMNTASCEEEIALRAQMAHLLNEKEKLFRELMKLLPIYKQLKAVMKVNKVDPDAKEKLSESGWLELKAEIDRISDNFSIRLSQKHELFTENDVRFCCLLKLGLKYAELALLYGCEPNAMYKRRDAVLKKMPSTSAGGKLEDVIKAF